VLYPRKAEQDSIEGTVRGYFVMDTSGSLNDIQLVKRRDLGCNEEVFRMGAVRSTRSEIKMDKQIA